MAEDLEMMVAELSVNTRKLTRQMENASGVFNKRTRQMERRAAATKKKIEQMMSLDGMKMAAGGFGMALGGHEIIGYADKWREAQNALHVVGIEGAETDTVLQALYSSAQKNAAVFNPLVEIYKNAAEVQGDLNASSADMLKFTQGVAVALKVGGASASASAGAMQQLGQLLASGTVHAEEFNSVQDGALPILQAVANGLGIEGNSVSALKRQVMAGKISSEQFFNAFLKGLPMIEARAKSAQMTVGQSFTALGNAMERYFGMAADNQGIEDVLANGVKGLADNFQEIANLATIAAAALGPSALLGAVRGLTGGVAALNAMVMANPLGALAALTVAAATAVYLYRDKILPANKALVAEKKAHDELNKVLGIAHKNHNKVAKDKVDTARKSLLAAKATLNEAEAQARLNLEHARAREALAQKNIMGPAPGQFGGPAGQLGKLVSVAIPEKELKEIHEKQKENAADLANLNKVTPVKPSKSNTPTGNADITGEKFPQLSQTAADVQTKAEGKNSPGLDYLSDLQSRTAALKTESATLDMSAAAADRYRVHQEAMAEVAKLEASGHDILALKVLAAADAYDKASKSEEVARANREAGLKVQQQEIEVADSFRSALEQIATNFNSAKSAAAGFLSMLSQMAAQEGVESLFGKRGTTLSGKSSGGGAADPGLIAQLFKQIPGFVGGTDDAPGGLAIVGEKGPELVNLPAHAQVVPHAALPDFRAKLNRMNQIVNHSNSIDNRSNVVVQGNADATTVHLMQSMLAQQNRQFESRWQAMLAKYNRTH